MIKKIMSLFSKKEEKNISQDDINSLIVKSGKADIYIERKDRDVDVSELSSKKRPIKSSSKDPAKCESCGGELAKKGNMISGNSKFEIFKCKDCNKEKMKAVGVMQ